MHNLWLFWGKERAVVQTFTCIITKSSVFLRNVSVFVRKPAKFNNFA